MRLTDHSGGTAADFNGLSFYPVVQTRHRRNISCYNTNNAMEISTSRAAVSMGAISMGWGNWMLRRHYVPAIARDGGVNPPQRLL
jgi:hypothetical protein